MKFAEPWTPLPANLVDHAVSEALSRTSYSRPLQTRPNVYIQPQRALLEHLYSESGNRGSYVGGYYSPVADHIVLDGEVNYEHPEPFSTLLHEVVHWLQYHNDITINYGGLSYLEREAYRVQLEYLRDAGVRELRSIVFTEKNLSWQTAHAPDVIALAQEFILPTRENALYGEKPQSEREQIQPNPWKCGKWRQLP